jgi:hypothetical protein
VPTVPLSLTEREIVKADPSHPLRAGLDGGERLIQAALCLLPTGADGLLDLRTVDRGVLDVEDDALILVRLLMISRWPWAMPPAPGSGRPTGSAPARRPFRACCL